MKRANSAKGAEGTERTEGARRTKGAKGAKRNGLKERCTGAVDYIKANVWTLLTITIVVMMSVMIGRNVVHAVSIGLEIGSLERERERYQYLVTRDSSLLEGLSRDEELVKFARENFFMQGANEEIYVIE